jgi:redox-sensitive bicupin YhaK (pirin superfamily)
MRTLQQTISARPTSDGDGVRISRIAGERINALIDPFLMLDEINSDDAADYIGGFPEHPHRGMETITYMKAGRMRHRDHMGNEGVIGPGDVQWMTAGKGVLHSEKPEQVSGLLHGFQLWLNLPASEKMKPAAYRDIRVADIPAIDLQQGSRVAVIAGEVTISEGDAIVNTGITKGSTDNAAKESAQLSGALPALSTQPVLIDVTLVKNDALSLQFNPLFPASVYVISGSLEGEEKLARGQMGLFSAGDALDLRAGPDGANLLVLSGKPLKEPIAQYGPFVMNTRDEIDTAISDFRAGRFV